MKYKNISLIIVFLLTSVVAFAQTGILKGKVITNGNPVEFANVGIPELATGTLTGTDGSYEIKNLPTGTYTLHVSSIGFKHVVKKFTITGSEPLRMNVTLEKNGASLNEVVITGTMKEISRLESPVPVEVITPELFRKNPTPSLFEAVGMVNGVKPQLNCNVCNTGDIHINGMEGPYTMILIDGMPIVSSLATVYGLSGIPNSMVERIEVVKGPASSLYGSEAMGGIINVITKNPDKAPIVGVDIFGTSWQEYSADASVKFKAGKAQSLLGLNYFNYQQPTDKNKDGFTDVTQQNRISVFNKWNFERKQNRVASIAGRYVYEDRWGGQINWDKKWRGTDSIYGESIYTRRWEMIGAYELPFREKVLAQFSFNNHDQDSYYGVVPYMAVQQVAFGQLYWDKQFGMRHNFLLGSSLRYTRYDDNTPGTASPDTLNPANAPQHTPLPGLFVQDQWTINDRHTLLVGYRYDYDKNHGSIHSPRIAHKWSSAENHVIRASFGTGFRVVNLFTEDHAALTGAREVVIAEALDPEKSYNANLNYVLQIPQETYFLGFDITGFYSYFTNKITGDFDSDPDKIIYQNLKGHAISKGISLNSDLAFSFPLKVLAGLTLMDVYQVEEKEGEETIRSQQLHAPKWSGTFTVSYGLPKNYAIDFTGNWSGPMRLPVLPNDFRPEYSPWFCIANVQLTKKFEQGLEVYGGVKNIFDFVPADPILRPFDPFDKQVNDPVNNPKGYTFDPTYNFASLQGARAFLGVRYNLFR